MIDPTQPTPQAPTPTPTPAPAPAPVPAPGPAQRPRRSRRRWWLAAAALPLTLIALLLLALAYLIYRPDALPWVLSQVPGVKTEGVQGTVAGGDLRIAKLSLTLPDDGGRLQIEQLTMQRRGYQFRPKPGIWLDLHFEALDIARLQWSSGKPSGQPPALPNSLRLPLTLRIDALHIGQVQIDQQPLVTDLRATLDIGADDGKRHHINDLSLVFEQIRLQGRLALAADAPLALDAKIDAVRSQAPAWTASLAVAGPLDRLVADARLQGDAPAGGKAPALSAQATLRPLAKWPLEALSLSTRELDLSSLSSQLPRTALAGRATLLSSGLDQPAKVESELVNTQPGSWDSGRLPLRSISLVASGELRHTDQLALERFNLQLADERGDAGRISGQGRWQGDTAELSLKLDALQPLRLDSRAPPINVSGPLNLRASGLQGAAPQLDFDAKLAGRALDGSGLPVQLQLAGEASAKHLLLRQLEASAGKARAGAELEARADASGWQIRGNTTLDRFDPLPWWSGPPDSAWRRGPHRLNGQLTLDLHIKPSAAGAIGGTLEQALRAFVGQATLRLTDSQLAGMPLAGELALRSGDARYNVDGSFKLAGSQLGLQGRIGLNPAVDRFTLTLDTPAFAALAPLGRLLADASPGLLAHWPTAGSVKADLQVDGRWPVMRSQGKLDLAKLASPDATLQQATLNWRAGTAIDDPLALQLDLRGLAQGAQRLDLLQAKIDGSLREHKLEINAESPLRPPVWAENLLGPTGTGTRMAATANGRWQPEPASGRTLANVKGGRWLVQKLDLQSGVRGLAAIASAQPASPGAAGREVGAAAAESGPWLRGGTPELELRLDANFAPTLLRLAPGRLQLLSTALAWREAQWLADGSGPGQLTLLAQLETIDVAKLLAKLQPNTGWAGNLTLGGRIEVRSGVRFDADVVLERLGGDLSLPDDLDEKKRLQLGLSELRLALSAHDGVWQFAQGLAGSSFGQMAGAQVLRTSADRRFPPPEAPLSGVIEAQVANLGTWGNWLPPGWRLAGQLRTGASFKGTLGAPQVLGEMRGDGIALRNVLLGVNLSDGNLAITLNGDRAKIERFSFKGGDGSLTLAGDATLGETPSARLQLKADKFRLLGRIDRRLIASGQAQLQLGADSLKLDGDLRIDEGLIDISRSAAPTLDDDVHVHGGGASQTAAPPPAPSAALRKAEVALRIDLGEQLRLKGRGISTGLRGKLVASSPGGRFALRGSIRTDGGQFAAYGQKLEIRRGEFDFNGAPDTARIDVLAVRPNLEVQVGVSVSGLALAPRVRLFSEPSMPDYDKLSWLMLGRAPDGLGRTDTALLQRAAMAALSGDGEGATDKVVNAIGLTDFGVSQTDGDSRDTVITLGKQLSERWYVGYERSVNTATGTWQLIYRVASRFTLRAQSGTDNALDVIWTWRW